VVVDCKPNTFTITLDRIRRFRQVGQVHASLRMLPLAGSWVSLGQVFSGGGSVEACVQVAHCWALYTLLNTNAILALHGQCYICNIWLIILDFGVFLYTINGYFRGVLSVAPSTATWPLSLTPQSLASQLNIVMIVLGCL
jgi:hypothetical protein